MLQSRLPLSWAVIMRDGLVLCVLLLFGISVPSLERIGAFYLFLFVAGIAVNLLILAFGIARSDFVREVSAQARNTPWYRNRRNQEGLAIERVGLISASVFVLSVLCLMHLLDANVYGVVIFNSVVALATRYAVVAGWALKQKRRLQRNEASVAEIKKTLKTNRTMPAIDLAIAAGAIAATAFSQDNIEPDWLTKWWVMFPIILTIIVSVGKMSTIWQPIELWHMLTKDQYRDEDEKYDH